ncbi:hypothetical protein RI129_010217 [Pyrocoelia pectoralis]|uniref:Uncharacterized protein n=1 Tax=Pyrocoelia pectoralis TaxID=417401 RepID=A0AAN7V3Y9_9COLE
MFDRSNLNATFATEIFQLLDNVTAPFDPLNVTTIQWLGEREDISTFYEAFTSEGNCLTFNMLAEEEILRYSDARKNSSRPSSKSHKWSLEKGYPSGDNYDAFPRRTFMPGLEGGLTIDSIYTNNSHLDHFCKGSLHGFKVTLHHPCELPNMDKYFRLPLNEALFVGIKPSLIMVSDELLNYPPKTRKCYFENEKYLSSYNIYTQQNCLDECLANYTVEQCACVPIYLAMPENETKICGLAEMECVKWSKLKYLEMESSSNKSGGERCDCLPSCTSLTYDVELSQTDWSWGKTYAVKKHLENKTDLNPNNTHLSYLSIYYKDLQFLSSERKELYGSLEFFSNTGGLLGLFFGFSIISLIELVHFLTVRILCNIRMYGRNAWSGHFN